MRRRTFLQAAGGAVIAWPMRKIGEQQAQLALADGERDLRFGLASADVQVVEAMEIDLSHVRLLATSG